MNSKGRGLTQRVEPKLSLIEVEMPKHAFSEEWEPEKSSNMGQRLFFYLLLQLNEEDKSFLLIVVAVFFSG